MRLALLALLALLAGGAPAWATSGFGSVVAPADADVTVLGLRALPAAAVCWLDADGDGAPAAGEPVFLAPQGCSVALRLPLAGALPGRNGTARALDAALRFGVADGDHAWDGDALYFVLGGRANVSAGDVRLAGDPAPGWVRPGDPDLGAPTLGSGPGFDAPGWAWWDADRDGKATEADGFYADLDGSRDASTGDVRVRAPAGGLAVLGPAEPEVVPRVHALPVTFAVCAVDLQGDGYTPGDPVYGKALG
ncbi:MAG: hypothetical protein LC624_09530, partial [Halobacteriales archaeon]|nr:hypothetical protein [Halobacteriales archaeon]